MDPLGDLANFVLGRLKQGFLEKVGGLLFQIALSAWGSFFFTCGTIVAGYAVQHFATDAPFESGPVWGLGLGSGMVVMVLAVVYWIRTDPDKIFKNMRFVLPTEEAAKEMATGFETITKSTDNKEK
jgi:hypothetical protein